MSRSITGRVEKDSSKNIGIIEGSLGSEAEKGTEKIVFTMPQDGVKLTAVYSIPASVLRSTVTVTGGTAKSTLGEGSDIPRRDRHRGGDHSYPV